MFILASQQKEQEKKGKIYIYHLHFIKNEMLYVSQKFLKEMLSEKYWVGQKVHSGFSIPSYKLANSVHYRQLNDKWPIL